MASIDWLLESSDPGIRYLANRDLLDLPLNDPGILSARQAAHQNGPISTVLDRMQPEGYWSEPGPGYHPKYFSTVWSIILLSQLGAAYEVDERIPRACSYLLEKSLTSNGQFSMFGTPSGTVDCLQGNLCTALVNLGCQDPRLDLAFDWMARSVTGEGVAPASEKDAPLRFYAGKCGPGFACGANDKLPCAWGATKVMLAFALWPEERRSPLIERAIQQGVEFLFSVDPVTAAYPCGYTAKPSGNWWKFGFPVFYVTDLLQIVEAMVSLGYAQDPRLENVIEFVRKKQDEQGAWSLEYDYSGKTWIDFGARKKPNPWVTIRALRALKECR